MSSDADDRFDPNFPSGIVDEDFDTLVPPQDDEEDDGYWISEEQQKEMFRPGEYPKATDWKDVPLDENMHDIVVTIDKARRQIWNQGRTEIGILRKKWGEPSPAFNTLAERTFGRKSRLFHLMIEELDLSFPTYCRWLASFFAACSRKQSVTQLLNDKRFDSTGFLNSTDNLNIFCRIESLSVGGETLWMKIERVFNIEMKDSFLSVRGTSKLTIALDDDKQPFNYSKNAHTYGLQRCRHIQKNRFGHTAHTAGLSATGIILCVMFQREGESLTQVYERMTKSMFGDQGGNGDPDLHGITFCSDRGYWTPVLVFEMLLRWGADIVGTVARCFWFPFVYSKVPQQGETSDKHNRTQISTKGFRDVFYKTYKHLHVRIRAVAFRSGTGNVSLAMSTVHNFHCFDFNTAFPKDSKWAFDQAESQETRNRRPFRLVCGSSEYSNLSLVINNPVIPLTCVQGDACWFEMRKLSITSSTADKAISERAREITADHPLRDDYEIVLGTVGRLSWLPAEADVDDDDDDDINSNNNSNNNCDRSIDDDNSHEEEVVVEDNDASYWLSCIGDSDKRDAFINDLPNLDVDTIKAIVTKHKNSNPNASMVALRKKLKEWAEQPSKLHRKYHWYNVQQLKSRIKEIDTRVPVIGNKIAVLNLLVECETKQKHRNDAIAIGEDPFVSTDTIDPVLHAIFQASYMKKLVGEEQKRYCRQGHENEAKFLLQFHEHSKKGITLGYNSISVYETPLVESTSSSYFLDSADAELVFTRDVASNSGSDSEDDDDTLYTIPVEIKSRLSHTTFYDERERQQANLGFNAWENNQPSYVELDAASDEFFRWIPKSQEKFQLLHHVAIRNGLKGLIIVGDTNDVMFGVFVNYKQETIDAYKNVLQDVYERALEPFYQKDPSNIPREKIKAIISSKEMKPIGLTVHSFLTSFFLWRKLRIVRDIDNTIQLPLPPCNRILPYNHSFWNNQKGASDTATKLMWSCPVKLSSAGRSQTVVLARFLQLFAIHLHRQNHAAQANADLNSYASLFHLRNTMNQNWPFPKTLNTLEEWLIKQADDFEGMMTHGANYSTSTSNSNTAVSNENLPPTRGVTFATTPPRTQRDNPRNAFQEHRFCSYTGATPGKGKPRVPKVLTDAHHADQKRLESCSGEKLFKKYAAKGEDVKKGRCFLCNTQTPWVCLGCKRHVCIENRDDKLRKSIADGDNSVSFLNGVRPPAQLTVESMKDDGTSIPFCTVINSCHQILHSRSSS